MALSGAAPTIPSHLDAVLKQDTDQKKAPVHTFDPNASPQEKAAAAGKARTQVQSIVSDDLKPSRPLPAGGKGMPRDLLPQIRKSHSTSFSELKIDPGRSTAVPTITVNDHDSANSQAVAEKAPDTPYEVEDDDEASEMPGSMVTRPAPAIPDWYRVGWRQNAGLDDNTDVEGEAKLQSLLNLYVSEQYYGDWYHNAAVIVLVRSVSTLLYFSAKIRRYRLFLHLISSLSLALGGVGCLSSSLSATRTIPHQ